MLRAEPGRVKIAQTLGEYTMGLILQAVTVCAIACISSVVYADAQDARSRTSLNFDHCAAKAAQGSGTLSRQEAFSAIISACDSEGSAFLKACEASGLHSEACNMGVVFAVNNALEAVGKF
jgi:hypothetical protein